MGDGAFTSDTDGQRITVPVRVSASAHSDPQWIMVVLQAAYALRKIVLHWQDATAKVCEIALSANDARWTSVAKVTDGQPVVRAFELDGGKWRYIPVTGTQRTTGYGYSL